MMQSLKSRATERPVADAALFFVFTFLITWGTGMVLVFSTHASMVNGAHPVEHPIPLPLTVAIVLALVGGFGPFLAATAVAALREVVPRYADFFVSSSVGESIRCGISWLFWGPLCWAS